MANAANGNDKPVFTCFLGAGMSSLSSRKGTLSSRVGLYVPLTCPALEHVRYRLAQSRYSPSIDLFHPDSISFHSLPFPNIITLTVC
ncbi:hypothetical protein M404DRAFT_1004855 [Pisolithus tinctorius Marx 270]|uniref:Uncharacterized protein n=1 Tax=Pisolithus tinctorius Marx 270 TaxID=870435 RepID=A0A0C3NVC6_PISTI|nr:hypothetical protein M404DRAFT_1004855 [Pisolithus tinctorius Marx 270]